MYYSRETTKAATPGHLTRESTLPVLFVLCTSLTRCKTVPHWLTYIPISSCFGHQIRLINNTCSAIWQSHKASWCGTVVHPPQPVGSSSSPVRIRSPESYLILGQWNRANTRIELQVSGIFNIGTVSGTEQTQESNLVYGGRHSFICSFARHNVWKWAMGDVMMWRWTSIYGYMGLCNVYKIISLALSLRDVRLVVSTGQIAHHTK